MRTQNGASVQPEQRPQIEALTRTLILEIAVPGFYAEDYTPDDEAVAMFLDLEDGEQATPEQLADTALEDSGLTTPRVNLSLLLGSKDGNFLERVKGQLVGARIVPREADHELADDDRLDDQEARERGE